MATWYDHSALDALLNSIKTGVNTTGQVILIASYTQGDDYATIIAGNNKLAEATITSANFDANPSDQPGEARRLNFTGASGFAVDDGGGATNHIALVSTGDTTVHAVTEELSTQAVTNGNPVTFPSFYMQANQPIQA